MRSKSLSQSMTVEVLHQSSVMMEVMSESQTKRAVVIMISLSMSKYLLITLEVMAQDILMREVAWLRLLMVGTMTVSMSQ